MGVGPSQPLVTVAETVTPSPANGLPTDLLPPDGRAVLVASLSARLPALPGVAALPARKGVGAVVPPIREVAAAPAILVGTLAGTPPPDATFLTVLLAGAGPGMAAVVTILPLARAVVLTGKRPPQETGPLVLARQPVTGLAPVTAPSILLHAGRPTLAVPVDVGRLAEKVVQVLRPEAEATVGRPTLVAVATEILLAPGLVTRPTRLPAVAVGGTGGPPAVLVAIPVGRPGVVAVVGTPVPLVPARVPVPGTAGLAPDGRRPAVIRPRPSVPMGPPHGAVPCPTLAPAETKTVHVPLQTPGPAAVGTRPANVGQTRWASVETRRPARPTDVTPVATALLAETVTRRPATGGLLPSGQPETPTVVGRVFRAADTRVPAFGPVEDATPSIQTSATTPHGVARPDTTPFRAPPGRPDAGTVVPAAPRDDSFVGRAFLPPCLSCKRYF